MLRRPTRRTDDGFRHPHRPGSRRCERPRRVATTDTARVNYVAAFSLLSLQCLTRERDWHTRYPRVLPSDSRAILQKAAGVLCLHTLHASVGGPAPRLLRPNEDRKVARVQGRRACVAKSKFARALLPSRHPRKRNQCPHPVLTFALCR